MTELWRISGEWQGSTGRTSQDVHCAGQLCHAAMLPDDRKSEAINSVVLAALRAGGFIETADEFERAVL